MQLQAIEDALLAPGVQQNWRETLDEWTEADPAQAQAVLARVTTLRDEFVQAARDIDDPETLDMVAAIRFIELKSHWILLNTRVNYSMVFKGEADMSLAYLASLISQLLGALERLIDERDVARIIDFLAQPVGTETPVEEAGFRG